MYPDDADCLRADQQVDPDEVGSWVALLGGCSGGGSDAAARVVAVSEEFGDHEVPGGFSKDAWDPGEAGYVVGWVGVRVLGAVMVVDWLGSSGVGYSGVVLVVGEG